MVYRSPPETDEAIVEMKDAVGTMIDFTSAKQTGIHPPLWLPIHANRKYSSAREKVHRFINALIAQRHLLPETQRPNDLLTRLMEARDEETGESMAESLLRDESITMFYCRA